MLMALLLLSATPASVEKKVKARRSSVTIHAWFSSGGYNIDICALPIWMPQAYVWGDTTVNINCPSSAVVVNVTEGQTVSFSTAVYLKLNILSSYPHVVTAAEIAAGSVDLAIPM